MAPGGPSGPIARTDPGTPARQTITSARRAALFASELQRSDAPTAAMAAQAITATVRRFGIHGCLSRMAQEFGDHPDAAAARMRWICQLTAQMRATRIMCERAPSRRHGFGAVPAQAPDRAVLPACPLCPGPGVLGGVAGS